MKLARVWPNGWQCRSVRTRCSGWSAAPTITQPPDPRRASSPSMIGHGVVGIAMERSSLIWNATRSLTCCPIGRPRVWLNLNPALGGLPELAELVEVLVYEHVVE